MILSSGLRQSSSWGVYLGRVALILTAPMYSSSESS